MSKTESALLEFLETLDVIHEHAPSVTDTEVREVLAKTIIERLVRDHRTHPIPSNFRMLDPTGKPDEFLNRDVERAVQRFVKTVESCPEWGACSTNAERQALIARNDLQSRAGHSYWQYLGPWEYGYGF